MNADQLRSGSGPSERYVVWYYRHGEVAVNNHYVRNGPDRYPIAELADLAVTRDPAHPGVTISLVIAVVQAPLVVPVIALVRSPLVWLAAAVGLVIPLAVAFVYARCWPRRRELLATYRGRAVVLFASRDEREFGQVARAVGRAIEALFDR